MVLGSGETSIIVREAAALDSALIGRLRAGTVVRELAREGARVRFAKVAGEGPDEGWVSWRNAQGQRLMQQLDHNNPIGESEQERRWRMDLGARRARDAERREAERLDLEARVRSLERREAEDRAATAAAAAADAGGLHQGEEPFREVNLEDGSDLKAEVGGRGGYPIEVNGVSALWVPNEHQDEEVVRLWADGDGDIAWWHEKGPEKVCLEGGEGGTVSVLTTPKESFFIPDHDPEEVDHEPCLVSAAGVGQEASRQEVVVTFG